LYLFYVVREDNTPLIDITATDATAEASVIIPIYSSFDFDGEGKILFQQNFGDFTAAFNSLN